MMNIARPRQSVLLNFDDSAGQPVDCLDIDLSAWQEKIRFSCKWSSFNGLQQYLQPRLPAVDQLGCVLMGSGDYHHLTQLLLSRHALHRPLHVIVCDNHPDNMRYPFGIHCGSWVYWASRLPQVARIDVIGMSSSDIGWKHAWENHCTALMRGKLHYWSVQQSASWLAWIGAKKSWHGFESADELMQSFCNDIDRTRDVYLSIDKDVFSEQVVRTNWDQGQFLEQHVMDLIQACQQRLVGADITGDVSAYHYVSRFKRLLSASDGQSEPDAAEVLQWQVEQKALNQRLVQAIDRAWC